MDEKSVREWLKRHWPIDPLWIEAARGGSFGAPDAMLPCPELYVACELKFWHADRDGLLKVNIRPPQRVWHMRAARAGSFTFALVGWEENRRVRVGYFSGDEFWQLGQRVARPAPLDGVAPLAATLWARLGGGWLQALGLEGRAGADPTASYGA